MTEKESTDMDIDVEEATKQNKNVPNPSASGESVAKYPDMDLAQSIHKLHMIEMGNIDAEGIKSVGISSDLKKDVMKKVGPEELENPTLYKQLCSSLNWKGDLGEKELNEMEENHKKTVEGLEAKVVEARESAGEMEVLDARLEVARFAAKALSKESALEAYDKVIELPKLSSGKIIDALMESARIASFYGDTRKNREFIERASKLAGDGGDWDRRNRLKVYNALDKLLSRDIKGAASLLVDCIATFSCTELCSYTDFIVYTIITNILHLPRTELKEKIIDGSEILSIKNEVSAPYHLVKSLYDCDYKAYLHAMVEIQPFLVSDRFLERHSGYLMRELHVLGYKQFLDSYKSVTLESMAGSFGVSSDFLDIQLSRFIAAGRLTAKIDKFGGVVETNRPDLKNAQYREMIQKGDLLLNRVQKLSRVVDL